MTEVQRKALDRYRLALTAIQHRIREVDEVSKETGFDPDPWMLIDGIRAELAHAFAPSSCPATGFGGDEVRDA